MLTERLKTCHEGQKVMEWQVNMTATIGKLTFLIETAEHAQMQGKF